MKMSFLILLASVLIFFSCQEAKKPEFLQLKKELPKEMKEVSGLVASGDHLWAVSDKPKASIVKMDTAGKIVQEITIEGVKMIDVETIAADDSSLYIGDVGDNDGTRDERIIYKIALASIGTGKVEKVKAEVISFTFAGDVTVEKKKLNEHDCEAMIHYNGSLFLFTKRRTDKDSEVFEIPTQPGKHVAKQLGMIKTEGMVTGASINKANNEIALIGYQKDHLYPFILLLSEFDGSNIISSKMERIELADKEWDWQLESIAYTENDNIYFACEETKDVPATLYAINRNNMQQLNKKKSE